MKSFLLAVLAPPLLLLAWVAVQAAWRREFLPGDADGDVLAARGNCGQCGCATPCEGRENKRNNKG